MTYPRTWRVVVPVAAALLVAACTGGANPRPTPTVGVGDTVEPLWTVRVEAMSQPYVIDGVAVAYVAVPDGEPPEPHTYDVHKKMEVVAWDAETGAELWRHDAVPGRITGSDDSVGYASSPDVTELDGSQIVDYLVADPDSDGTFVATADLHTGKEARYGPVVWATSRPYSCDSDPWRGVCLRGTFAGEADAHMIELDLESGTLATVPDPTPANPVPEGAEQLGSGVFFADGNLGFADDLGEVRWTRPYEDVLGPGSSPQGITAWLDRHDGLLVGLGSVSIEVAGEYDASAVMSTVVVSTDTGETVASVPGIPCTGTWSYSDVVLTVCVETGTVTFPGDGSRKLTYTDHQRYAVGIDVKTGEQKWRLPAKGAQPVTDDSSYLSDYPFVRNSSYLVVTWSEQLQVVETLTGTVSELDDDTAFLCWSPWDSPYSVPLTTAGAGSESLPFDRDVVEVCDVDGMPTEASWPAYFVKAAFFSDRDFDGE
ncbi:MAG: hypothetical protein FWD11_09235, partial [Micrococcales bacterium]|nr:hypothetical protein [Micrococcales bacterium]